MSCICGYLHFTRDLQYESFYLSQYILQFIIIKTKRKLLKKIFNEFSFTKEIIIYTWGNDEEDIHLNLNTEQIKLISDIDINLSIIHYN